VDPANTALRWGIVVSRRQYSVPWPNSLWHLDGHHSLIRWGLVIHGCIDGFSRWIMFLRCSNNNLSQTVLELFLKPIENDALWPSCIRETFGFVMFVFFGCYGRPWLPLLGLLGQVWGVRSQKNAN